MGEKKRMRTVEWKRQQVARSAAEICKAKMDEYRLKKNEEKTDEPGSPETSG